MEKFNEVQNLFVGNKNKTRHFHSDVLVPIIQNLIGGLSIGLLYFFWLSKGVFLFTSPHISFCIMLALVIASLFNVVRFFGDEIGLFYLAFRMGQLFSPKTNAKETGKLLTTLTSTGDNTINNALKLIIAHYKVNLAITQADASRSLKFTRKDFEDARALLIKKGLLKNSRSNKLESKDVNDALKIFNTK